MRSLYASFGLIILVPCLALAQYWRTPSYGYGVQVWQGFTQIDTSKIPTDYDLSLKQAYTDTSTWDATKTYVLADDIGQMIGYMFVGKAFTDIGSSWTDVYVTNFDAEEMLSIDFTNVDSIRVVYMVDHVGSGTDSVRWANVADNSQILIAHKYTSDCMPCIAGWSVKPAAFTGAVVIEQQAMSPDAGTNDPVYKGYVLWGK